MAKLYSTYSFRVGKFNYAVSVCVLKDRNPLILRFTTARIDEPGKAGTELPEWGFTKELNTEIPSIEAEGCIASERARIEKAVTRAVLGEK